MNGQGRKGLRGALGESYIGQRALFCEGENVIDAVGNIIKSELINREVPKGSGGWREACRLLGVFVPAIIAEL